MPGCSVVREVRGCTAHYTMAGRFDGSCAWELSSRLAREPLGELVLDFSRVGDFVDYAIAIVANGLAAVEGKNVHLRGLRQHQERVLRYFGVDAADPLHLARSATTSVPEELPALTRELGRD